MLGPSGSCFCSCHLSPSSPGPGSQCPSRSSVPGAQAPVGCLQKPTATLASGPGLWQGWGLSWRAGLSLAAAGRAGAPLPRVGAKQGSEGAVGRGAATLHLQAGSQGSVLARAPLGGGQGIWKDSRRVASRRASGALEGPLCFGCPASEGSRVPSEDRARQQAGSPVTEHPSLTRSPAPPATRADWGWAPGPAGLPVPTLPQGPPSVPGRETESPPHQGAQGSAERRGVRGGCLHRGRDPRAGPDAGAGDQPAEDWPEQRQGDGGWGRSWED